MYISPLKVSLIRNETLQTGPKKKEEEEKEENKQKTLLRAREKLL